MWHKEVGLAQRSALTKLLIFLFVFPSYCITCCMLLIAVVGIFFYIFFFFLLYFYVYLVRVQYYFIVCLFVVVFEHFLFLVCESRSCFVYCVCVALKQNKLSEMLKTINIFAGNLMFQVFCFCFCFIIMAVIGVVSNLFKQINFTLNFFAVFKMKENLLSP